MNFGFNLFIVVIHQSVFTCTILKLVVLLLEEANKFIR